MPISLMSNIARLVSAAIVGLFLWSSLGSAFDVVLDPRQVNQMLNEIGKFYDESQKASRQEDRLDALYEMGERCLDLADLMTRDKQSHGVVDANLAAVIQRRLKPYGIDVVADALGYHYDLAAFREYLRRAPAGQRAADAKYVLIGFDQPEASAASLQKSIAAKEAFIRQYPNYSEMSLVKFLLAQQHLDLARLYTAQKNPTLSGKQRQLAQYLYRQVVKEFPTSPEAEAAADYLAQAGATK